MAEIDIRSLSPVVAAYLRNFTRPALLKTLKTRPSEQLQSHRLRGVSLPSSVSCRTTSLAGTARRSATAGQPLAAPALRGWDDSCARQHNADEPNGSTVIGSVLFGVLHETLFYGFWIVVPLMTADCIAEKSAKARLG